MTNNYLAHNTDKFTSFILFKASMFLNTVIIVTACISKIGFLDLKKNNNVILKFMQLTHFKSMM